MTGPVKIAGGARVNLWWYCARNLFYLSASVAAEFIRDVNRVLRDYESRREDHKIGISEVIDSKQDDGFVIYGQSPCFITVFSTG